MASILDGLNEAQRAAVTSPSDVLQILAPPGSGKTKTLTSRVAYLLQHYHYHPWDIICLTFTIKSSREMRERLAKLLGNGVEKRLILGTFHSVCRRYLVTYGHLIGLQKGFGIADASDSISIIRRIIKSLKLNLDPRKAQSRISSSKSRGVSRVETAQNQAKKNDVEQQEFVMVFEAYEDQLGKSNLLDYDDLLLRCVDLLRQHLACVSNVEVVLIDEFQDTNFVQFELMRLFATQKNRVMTVGDPDQSIYGWRSAEIKNLTRMKEQYPDTLVIHLEKNYRSSAAILLAAHEVIEQDDSRPSKPLLSTHCPGTVPVLRRLPSSEIEARWTVSEIQRSMALTGNLLDYSDFAILFRSISLSRQTESAMGKAGVPYRVVGGHRFFDRAEVKILLDYLRVVMQPNNNDALSRIINLPLRGIGPNTVNLLMEEAEGKKSSLWMHIRGVMHGYSSTKVKVTKSVEQGLGFLINIILTSRNSLSDPSKPRSPENLLKYVIKKLDFQAYLKRSHADDHEGRWANVEELLAQAAEYPVVQGGSDREEEEDSLPYIEGLLQADENVAEAALSKLLANVALATELQREDDDTEGDRPQSQVMISTIHAAKGLEWPVVFVPSAYEGIIPHSRAEDTDEERRLLYVAMTRAQALLYMSCPTKSSQKEETKLSTFLSTKQVTQYIADRAPALDLGTVNDICHILGRDYPNKAQIEQASQNLQSHHDDLWPLNGEEDVKAIGTRWSKWDSYNKDEHVAKRQRTNSDEDVDCRETHGDVRSLSVYGVSTVGSTTTMQNNSAFSYGGFVTATLQHEHEEQHKGSEVKPTRVKDKRKNTSSQNGQGSLMSFLGKGNKPDAKLEHSCRPKGNAQGRTAKRSLGHEHCGDRKRIPAFSTNTHVEISSESGLPISRKPLATIPQSLASHRLPTLPSTSRPSPISGGDGPPEKQYVFLSSSPESACLLKEAEAQVEEPFRTDVTTSLVSSAFDLQQDDVKPATTFHATSIMQVQSAANVSKKTLGMRRSMNGWAARSNQGFAVPKMVKPK